MCSLHGTCQKHEHRPHRTKRRPLEWMKPTVCSRSSLSFSPACFLCFFSAFSHLLSSLNAHDRAHSASQTKKATSLLLPALCCLSVFLSHLSSLKQRNRFQFHVFSFQSSICLFLHPPLSILISGNQSAVNNLLNSIDRHHLVSWPAT